MTIQSECQKLTVGELCRRTDLLTCQILGSADQLVSGISMDSRLVSKGDLFCCVNGASTDGHLFIKEAIKKGASALLVDHYISEAENITQIIVENVRKTIGKYAQTLYGDPSTKLQVIGITGTNGKTTTASLLSSILNDCGLPTRVFGTLTGERTTPEAPIIQKQLAQAVVDGMKTVVMEVTSHAIDQSRIHGVLFEIAVFTNISRDHLDYHATQEAYFAAKAALFRQGQSNRAVVNIDDIKGRLLFDAATIPTLSFGVGDVSNLIVTATSIRFDWAGVTIAAPIGGRFNVMNLIAACTVARELGITVPEISKAVTKVRPVPGRFEIVDMGQDFAVVVDFAHTPDGLIEVLQAARAVCRGRVHVVFGCGGNRDAGKRPLMGAAATQHADIVVVTSDNPRREDALEIMNQILAGVTSDAKCVVSSVADRRDAIRQALQNAATGDMVIIAGKGHEKTQEFADHHEDFDDVTVVRELLLLKTGNPT